MSLNIASSIKFNELCNIFEKTCASKKQGKSVPLNLFIREYKENALKLKNESSNALISFYPALRLILPHLERERGPYGLKEYTLAKRIIKILCLPPQGGDAIRLINFRSTGNANIKDFADSAYWILRKHFLDGSRISILEVNQYLDLIAQFHADNNPRGVDEHLHNLFKSTDASEQKWLIRIILKELKLGMGQDRILKLYHPDAADLFTVNNSLSIVCDTLSDVSIRIHEIEVTMFSPFRPMLSQRCDASHFKKLFSKGPKLYIETKFDGERFQLHMDNFAFKYFSRNGFDYTSIYGPNFASGFYTPLLKKAFKPHVRKLILDGEMMGWNKKTNKFGSKGMDFDVKHLKPHNIYQPCFCVFDILLLNDTILTNKPLHERLLLLDKIITPIHGVIMTSHRVEAMSQQHILDSLNRSMDKEEEGIVFKDIDSVYKSNNRNAGWWKMKLEYFENVMSDLDVIVIGGYYGEGKRCNRITGFLVGVSVPATDKNISSQYFSLAKIATGLSEVELKTVYELLGPHWKNLNDENPENYGIYWAKEKPDVWIPPNKSCIFLVRASELIRSTDFKTKYTLRFPRIQKLRLDKPFYDCLTLTELEELTSAAKAVHKLSKRHLDLSDLEIVEKEKKIRRKYVHTEIQPVNKKSDILSGYEFCVLTGYNNWKKEDVEIFIRENGGTAVLTEGTNTLCLLLGDNHPRINSCKEFGAQCDLVKLQWLQNIVDTGTFKLYSPGDLLYTTKGTHERFVSEYDKYGDSYIADLTLETIPNILSSIKESKDYVFLTPLEIKSLQDETKFKKGFTIFENILAYFDTNKEKCDTVFALEETIFKFLGGSISKILNEHVSLVIIEQNNASQLKNIKERLNCINNNKAVLVDKDYIYTKFTAALNN